MSAGPGGTMRRVRKRVAGSPAAPLIRRANDALHAARPRPEPSTDGGSSPSWGSVPDRFAVKPRPRAIDADWPEPPDIDRAGSVVKSIYDTGERPPVMDLALLEALNEEYRSKPLVPEPPANDQDSREERARQRILGVHREIDLADKRTLELGCGVGVEVLVREPSPRGGRVGGRRVRAARVVGACRRAHPLRPGRPRDRPVVRGRLLRSCVLVRGVRARRPPLGAAHRAVPDHEAGRSGAHQREPPPRSEGVAHLPRAVLPVPAPALQRRRHPRVPDEAPPDRRAARRGSTASAGRSTRITSARSASRSGRCGSARRPSTRRSTSASRTSSGGIRAGT